MTIDSIYHTLSEMLQGLIPKEREARVLAAIMLRPGITGADIAHRTDAQRSDVYVEIRMLEERGFVSHKKEDSPRKYRAVPVAKIIQLIVGEKQAEIDEIQGLESAIAGLVKKHAVPMSELDGGDKVHISTRRPYCEICKQPYDSKKKLQSHRYRVHSAD